MITYIIIMMLSPSVKKKIRLILYELKHVLKHVGWS